VAREYYKLANCASEKHFQSFARVEFSVNELNEYEPNVGELNNQESAVWLWLAEQVLTAP